MRHDKKAVCGGHSLLSVPFVFSAIILVLAAVGLRPGLQALAAYYAKESIAINRPLQEFDMSRLPGFRTGWEFKSEEITDDIETEEYLLLKMNRESYGNEVESAILFVTYYSNPGDKIPHSPDVCNRQAGAIIKKLSPVTIDIPELAPEYSKVEASLLLLQKEQREEVIIYTFFAEGQFCSSRNRARWVISKPGNRHVYFSKIEAIVPFPIGGDPQYAIELCEELLTQAIPILVKEYFPTRQQIKRN